MAPKRCLLGRDAKCRRDLYWRTLRWLRDDTCPALRMVLRVRNEWLRSAKDNRFPPCGALCTQPTRLPLPSGHDVRHVSRSSCIYVGVPLRGHRLYVGKTSCHIGTRFSQHVNGKVEADAKNFSFQQAIRRYGEDKYILVPVERLDLRETSAEFMRSLPVRLREQYWIDRLNTRYPKGHNRMNAVNKRHQLESAAPEAGPLRAHGRGTMMVPDDDISRRLVYLQDMYTTTGVIRDVHMKSFKLRNMLRIINFVARRGLSDGYPQPLAAVQKEVLRRIQTPRKLLAGTVKPPLCILPYGSETVEFMNVKELFVEPQLLNLLPPDMRPVIRSVIVCYRYGKCVKGM